MMPGLVLAFCVAIIATSCREQPAAGKQSPETAKPKRLETSSTEPKPLDVVMNPEGGKGQEAALGEMIERAKEGWHLKDGEIQRLLAFISGPKPESMREGEWEERVNVILNLLRRQAEGSSGGSLRPVPGLTDYLLSTADRNPNFVLRVYALQHLALWHAKEVDAGKQREIVAKLEELANRPGDRAAGSAVLMLADIWGGGGGKNPADVEANPEGEQAMRAGIRRLIADSNAPADARVSAIHASVDLGDTVSLPELRRIAMDTASIGPLRKAAIHALGRLGEEEDLELLISLPQDDRYLAQAIGPAREKLLTRLGH